MRKMILLEAESFLTSFFKKAITLHINKQSFHSVTRSRHAQLFKGKKMQEKGIKHDNGKPRPDLIFSAMARALLEVSKVAAMGAAKYDDDNWLIVEDASKRYRDAKGRHLLLGAIEPHDNESNITHLAHEAWNALAVLELHLRNLEEPRQVTANWPASADERMLPIMQNGNDGEHYGDEMQLGHMLTIHDLKRGGWWCADTSEPARQAFVARGFWAADQWELEGLDGCRLTVEENVTRFNGMSKTKGLREITLIDGDFYYCKSQPPGDE